MILTLCMWNLCMAHQISLCSRSQLVALGEGWRAATGRRFMSGVLGVAHIFGASSYFFRIWMATVSMAANISLVDFDITTASAMDTSIMFEHKVTSFRAELLLACNLTGSLSP